VINYACCKINNGGNMYHRYKDFTVLITKISRSIKRIKTFEMEEINLKSSHVSCLYYLYKEGKLTATEICEISEEDKAQISRALDYLELHGYVVCESNQKKRYKSHFDLTVKGKEVSKHIANKIDNILDEVSNELTEEERMILYKSLNVISTNLEKINERNGEENEY
jgi:DNA-binding MarR family transcriptional regulator